jgi:hypothetical protein
MRIKFLGVVTLVALLLAGKPAYSQVDTGAILGTVKDQSGAVVWRGQPRHGVMLSEARWNTGCGPICFSKLIRF